jgi:histidinol-phosphate/aromatic aminotransferase/cobyric acid decarboxylase-like protein
VHGSASPHIAGRKMFSSRFHWDFRPNRLTQTIESRRREGARILDLTESNPTRAGFDYPPEIVKAFDDARMLLYEPAAAGLIEARRAVASYYAARGHDVATERILLTASTSEAYAYLFKLLCNPGDQIAVPRPSYPLFEFLANLESVEVRQYSLSYHGEWAIDFDSLAAAISSRTRAVVLVNPNNPTGQMILRGAMEPILAKVPPGTRLWVDEAYIDYTGSCESVEKVTAHNPSVVVCKSLSKVYALSGARVAYLCGHPSLIRTLRRLTPPWAVSLLAQVAAVAALREPAYYAQRYQETAVLRTALVSSLKLAVPTMDVLEGAANFVLCRLPPQGPDAATVCEYCRTHDVFLRDIGTMSSLLGRHALRIAIKDASTNRKIVKALAESLQLTGPHRHP